MHEDLNKKHPNNLLKLSQKIWNILLIVPQLTSIKGFSFFFQYTSPFIFVDRMYQSAVLIMFYENGVRISIQMWLVIMLINMSKI